MGIIENERAQFMLLAGFIIAIGLVITTVMLNNIIFESNMAGEAGGDSIKYDVVNLMRISGDEIKSAYRNVTNVSAPKNNKITNFSKQMNNFNSNLSQINALHGKGMNVSWDVNNWNKSIYANFTENGTVNGAANWTLIENVKNSTIIVNVSSINSFTFIVNISNATTYWHINFTNPEIRTINNTQIMQNITSAYSIAFINGSTTSGNYTIIGNTTYGKGFTRARDYIINATIILFTSNMRANITIPVSVPW
ncbi:MAG: hypothetical protein OIN86_08630 [Candidatus Methanoperedens sp.]|nr:hypothetical protein [Candidatus Methanoperedens sp.]CAG1006479.1 hypothetical protein METP1_03347 [Methanosarcinales archaeon]